MTSSPGRTARSARTTVNPPTPESNTPIARRLYVVSCPIGGLSLRRPVTAGNQMSQFCYGSAEENALRALTLPRYGWIGTVRLECPDKLQKRCRFIIELSVEPADSR